MVTTIALTRGLRERGVPADFRATGQTGILIAGEGVAVDAVVADFISGAIEQLAPARTDDGWDLIEGQGSLFHPSFAGRVAGAPARRAARGAGAVPRARTGAHARDPRPRPPRSRRVPRSQSRRGAADQPRRAGGRHLPQHVGHGAGGRAPAVRGRPRTGWAFPAPIRSPSASTRSSTIAMSRTLRAQHDRFPLIRPFRIARGDEDRGRCGDGDDRRGRRDRAGRGRSLSALRRNDRRRARRDRAGPSADRAGRRPGRAAATRCPPGAARNAIDCALWDLEARLLGRDVAAMIGGPALHAAAERDDHRDRHARGDGARRGRCWRMRRC